MSIKCRLLYGKGQNQKERLSSRRTSKIENRRGFQEIANAVKYLSSVLLLAMSLAAVSYVFIYIGAIYEEVRPRSGSFNYIIVGLFILEFALVFAIFALLWYSRNALESISSDKESGNKIRTAGQDQERNSPYIGTPASSKNTLETNMKDVEPMEEMI